MIIQQPLIRTICVNRFHQSRTCRLTKNTAYILCNKSISLTDFDSQLMSLILHKGWSTNSGHYISMVKVGDIWLCHDTKITKIEFNNFCNSNTVYMLFYKRSARWKHWAGFSMDDACWVSWEDGIKTLYSTGFARRLLFIAYFHSFLLPFYVSPIRRNTGIMYKNLTLLWAAKWYRGITLILATSVTQYFTLKSP